MKYTEFRHFFASFPVIPASSFGALDVNTQVLRNQLSGWKKRGLVIELKKGLYILNDADRQVNVSRSFIANQLYPPSYVSLEYALMRHDLIPERVYDVTSVTTRKTASFQNPLGQFAYRHLSPERFFGFVEEKDENGLSVFVAAPEKAIVDFLYLNLARFQTERSDIFGLSFRFQNLEQLNLGKLTEVADRFKSKKLVRVTGLFCEFLAGEKSA